MSTEQQTRDHDEASRASLGEAGAEETDTVPGSGSTHPEPNPTGSVGLPDHSVADHADRG